MKRALVVLALVSFTGCESAAKHPAITIGTVTGTMGFGLCELSVGELGTCAVIGGIAALGLGGITALVTLLANTNAPDEPVNNPDEGTGTRDDVTAPPPGLPAWMQTDAGVPPQMTQSDAAVVLPDAAAIDGM